MEITLLSIFEELRFIFELLAAELVFLVPFVPARKCFKQNVVLQFIGYGLTSMCYFLLLKLPISPEIRQWLVSGWYILFALSTIVFCKTLFEIGTVDSLYVIASSYAISHMVYVLVHEATPVFVYCF